jgi:Tol biopolymer transport system component/plastocyanin
MRSILPAALVAALSLLGLGLAPALASADATVSVAANTVTFAPSTVTIQKGQKVTWNFGGGVLDHNLVFLAKDAPFPSNVPDGDPTDFDAPPNSTFSKTFAETGTFRYVCSLHDPAMSGTVIVEGGTPPPTSPLPPEPIAFASDRETPGFKEIFTMKGSTASPRRLTNNVKDDSAPAFTSDGAKIAFQSNRDTANPGDAHIFVMNADGSAQTNLTPGSLARNISPAWSPDNTKIAFSSDRAGDAPDIFVMNADGSGLRQLTSGGAEDLEPTWSRDGKQIAFASDRSGVFNVWRIDVDPSGSGPGTNLTPITEGGSGGSAPAFSPTANRIVWARLRGSPLEPDICVIDLGAGTEPCVTSTSDVDGSPVWSPDGKQIMFTRRTGTSDRDLFLTAVDGGANTAVAITAPGDELRFEDAAWSFESAPLPPPTPSPTPTPTPTPNPGPPGGGAEPEDTRPDPGTAGAPGAFLDLDQPHSTRLKAFRKLGLAITARCVGVERGAVTLAVTRKLARRLGLKKTTLARATARCGADKRASAVLKPGVKVRKALATRRARKALTRTRGLSTTLSIALAGGGQSLRAKLPVLIRS